MKMLMLRTLARALQSSRRSNAWRTYGQLRNSSSIAPVNGTNGTGVSISAAEVYQGRSWMPRILYYPWAYGAVYMYKSVWIWKRCRYIAQSGLELVRIRTAFKINAQVPTTVMLLVTGLLVYGPGIGIMYGLPKQKSSAATS